MSESASPEQGNDFRETVTIAVGPNVDGLDHQIRAAHALAPDPSNVDDPERPEGFTPTALTPET